MGVHTGKFGVVNGQTGVAEWSISDNQSLVTALNSATANGTARRAGVEEWSGSFKAHGGHPLLLPGDQFNFAGYVAPDNDTLSGVGQRYTGVAIVNQWALTINWSTNELLSQQVDFGGHLALTVQEAQAAYSDSGVPRLLSPAFAKIEYSTDGTTWAVWNELESATLTITNAVQTYVNSSTLTGGRLWTGRKPGATDWNLSVVEQSNARDKWVKGTQLQLRVYINATEFFLLKWGVVKEFTGLQVSRESQAILKQTVNFEMNGSDVTTGALGQIVKPDLTAYWP
jgi:hypothetical protein